MDGIRNIFADLPAVELHESFEAIVVGKQVRIERIVSGGQSTPLGEWYDQAQDEWVLLLSGSAGLELENSSAEIVLKPGDHLLLPARCRHRVAWTDPLQKTVWLAVHFGEESHHGSN